MHITISFKPVSALNKYLFHAYCVIRSPARMLNVLVRHQKCQGSQVYFWINQKGTIESSKDKRIVNVLIDFAPFPPFVSIPTHPHTYVHCWRYYWIAEDQSFPVIQCVQESALPAAWHRFEPSPRKPTCRGAISLCATTTEPNLSRPGVTPIEAHTLQSLRSATKKPSVTWSPHTAMKSSPQPPAIRVKDCEEQTKTQCSQKKFKGSFHLRF